MPRSPDGPCPRSRSLRLPFVDVALRRSSQPGALWTTAGPNLGFPMCGIVAVLRRSSDRMPPDGAHLLSELEQAVGLLGDTAASPDLLARAAAHVEGVDSLLKGSPGVRALLGDRALFVGVEHHVEQLQLATDRVEASLDENAADL